MKSLRTTISGLPRNEILSESLPEPAAALVSGSFRIGTKLTALANRKKGPIIVQALPKSGGSWLSTLISLCTGFDKVRKSHIKKCKTVVNERYPLFGRKFSDFTHVSLSAMEEYRRRPIVMHTHLYPHERTCDAIKSVDGTVILLSRGLEGALTSWTHHLHRRFEDEVPTLDPRAFDFTIDNYGTEFARYKSDWSELHSHVQQSNNLELQYEDFVHNVADTLRQIFEISQITVGESRISAVVQALDASNTRNDTNFLSNGLKTRCADPDGWKRELNESQIKAINLIRARVSEEDSFNAVQSVT